MYVCPTCNQRFTLEAGLVKHFLRCWKERNPNHKSKDAPRSEDVVTRQVNAATVDFFASFKGDNK